MNSEVLIVFKGDTKDVNSKTNALETSIKGLTKKIAVGNIASQALGSTFNVLSSNMDSAIARFDTLNQFPKVMKNLGISAEEAEETLQMLSDSLTGLPTSLDQATGSVQRLTSKNGDVKKSGKYFLAMNNAILAGGGNAQTQASAIEQLSQAYAKGKPDMMEWRTIMTAMPAQMKQVAIAMGYVDADALGKALREGEVSMDKFMDTMVQLNEKGVGQFASFEEQARASTGGISTSITNMKTAITRGLANILTAIDNGLASLGGISGVIQKITAVINQVFSVVNKYLPPIIEWIIKTTKNVIKLIGKLKPLAPIVIGIATAIMTYKATVLAITTITKAWTIATKAMQVAQALLNGTIALNPIGLLIATIVALIAVIVYLWNNCEEFRNFLISAFEVIKNAFMLVYTTIKNYIELWWAIIQWLWNNYKKFIAFILNLPGKLIQAGRDMITKIKDGIIEKWNDFKEYIEDKTDFITGLFNWWDKFVQFGEDLINGIKQGVKNVWGGFKGWISKKADDIVGFFKNPLGIHSPSTVMADTIGTNIVAGIQVGYDSKFKNLKTDISKSLNSLIGNTMSLSPTLTGTASTHLSPTVNVVVNNNMKTDPLGQLVNNVKTFSGGAKNDYNYGYGG